MIRWQWAQLATAGQQHEAADDQEKPGNDEQRAWRSGFLRFLLLGDVLLGLSFSGHDFAGYTVKFAPTTQRCLFLPPGPTLPSIRAP